jgi:predicted nucleic acid-binding protein
MSSFGVVLDACVLLPASIRDTLLRTADAGLYRLHLTNNILEEVRRNLVKKEIIQESDAKNLIDKIKHYFPESFVAQHNMQIPSMPVNEKDRHVLAAAVASDSQVIVTQNLKDFPPHLLNSFDVEAQSPDDFLVNLFDPDTEHIIIKILINQAGDLRNPSKTVLELLDTLNQHTPNFVDLVRSSLNAEDVQ